MQHIAKPPACIPNNVADYNKTFVEINPLIYDILRSKRVKIYEFVGNVLNHEEEEVHNISVGAAHMQQLQVDDSVLTEKQREDQHNNNFSNTHIVVP